MGQKLNKFYKMKKIALVLLITTFFVVKLRAQSEQTEMSETPQLHRHHRLSNADVKNVFNYHGPELTKEQVCRVFLTWNEIHLSKIDGVTINYEEGERMLTNAVYYEVVLLPGEHVIEGYIDAIHIGLAYVSGFGKVYIKKKLSFFTGREQTLYPILLNDEDYKTLKAASRGQNKVIAYRQPALDIGVRVDKKPYRKGEHIPIIY